MSLHKVKTLLGKIASLDGIDKLYYHSMGRLSAQSDHGLHKIRSGNESGTEFPIRCLEFPIGKQIGKHNFRLKSCKRRNRAVSAVIGL